MTLLESSQIYANLIGPLAAVLAVYYAAKGDALGRLVDLLEHLFKKTLISEFGKSVKSEELIRFFRFKKIM